MPVPRFRFARPRHASVLVFDRQSETGLLPLLAEVDYETLDTRGSELNLSVLVKAIFSSAFWRGERQLAYSLAFARAVEPSLLITFIDNNTAFVDLCDRLPQATSAVIQNGHRNSVGHLVSDHKRQIDYYFTFNETFGSLVEDHITGKSIAIGSLRNNFVPIAATSTTAKPRVVFISQFFDRSDRFNYLSQDGTQHDWDEFFTVERLILPALARWCALKGLTLEIKSRYRSEQPTETAFFRSLDGLAEVGIVHSASELESYKLLDSGAMFVTIDSTLGYEALSRGARVAFVSTRGAQLGNDNREFAWPNAVERNGKYWLSDYTEDALNAVLNHVGSATSGNQNREQNKTVIEFDAGNSKLATLLNKYAKKKPDAA
jgi:surface carbohydrate biosynthesis protein